MKKIILSILFFTSLAASGQTYRYLTTQGETGRVRGALVIDGITFLYANDTLPVPISMNSMTGLVAKGDTLWRYSPIQHKWVPLGSGGAVTWGSITGTLSNQTDLQTALNNKQNKLLQGTTLQYFRGDLSLGTFSTDVLSVTNGLYSPLSHTHSGLLPIGGATGYMLRKNSNTDFDAGWYPAPNLDSLTFLASPTDFESSSGTAVVGVGDSLKLSQYWKDKINAAENATDPDLSQFVTNETFQYYIDSLQAGGNFFNTDLRNNTGTERNHNGAGQNIFIDSLGYFSWAHYATGGATGYSSFYSGNDEFNVQQFTSSEGAYAQIKAYKNGENPVVRLEAISTAEAIAHALEISTNGIFLNPPTTTDDAAPSDLAVFIDTNNYLYKRTIVQHMTTTQRNAISSPAEGLQVYNTTTHQYEYYNGTTWTAL